ncbi:MAG TPA: hypothetical protein VJI66_02250 [Candidatus Paceibacterota bacterium]
MRNKIYKNNEGFIALTLVITISVLLLTFSYMQSIDVAHFFDMTLRKKYRLMNYHNAWNCIDQAILNLAHDYFYEVHTPVTILDLHCSIDVVKSENGLKIIEATGNYKNIYVQRRAIARLYDNRVEIVSIE